MNVRYSNPTEERFECRFLKENFVSCLDEKSQLDQLTNRKCDVNWLPYFSLECPKEFAPFKNPKELRKIYHWARNAPLEDHFVEILDSINK